MPKAVSAAAQASAWPEPAAPASLADFATFATQVGHWQQQHGRHDLPWQATREPYHVWLSEVMLQQTQVATVRDYYARFLQRFPTVEALAAAHQDDVLALWSGLGYYSRARNLHACAVAVVTQHDGAFPRSAAQLQQLPGIGRSTAAAIASLCFGERVAILDGNVKRVLTRVLGFADDLSSTAHERRLWALANELLPQDDLPRSMPRHTQGMMDLGATVCLPRRPLCAQCPLRNICVAQREGTPENYPVKSRRLKRSAESLWLLLATTPKGAIWLQQRPPSGIWASLHCLPVFSTATDLTDALPVHPPSALQDLPVVKHVLTHKDLHLHPVRIALAEDTPPNQDGRWVTADDWPHLGLPAPIRKLLEQNASGAEISPQHPAHGDA